MGNMHDIPAGLHVMPDSTERLPSCMYYRSLAVGHQTFKISSAAANTPCKAPCTLGLQASLLSLLAAKSVFVLLLFAFCPLLSAFCLLQAAYYFLSSLPCGLPAGGRLGTGGPWTSCMTVLATTSVGAAWSGCPLSTPPLPSTSPCME